MIITDKATEEEIQGIVKYLNWEASELGNFIMGFGVPCEENVWKIDDDGTWLFDDAIMSVDTKDTTYHTVKAHYACEYWVAICGQWLKTDGRSVFDKIDPRVDRPADDGLYYDCSQVRRRERKLTFIPYYAWANRNEGEMTVWVND